VGLNLSDELISFGSAMHKNYCKLNVCIMREWGGWVGKAGANVKQQCIQLTTVFATG
jgi:hypothetical protein